MWLVHWPVIMACYDWTEEENMGYFLQAVKEQNVSTILDTNKREHKLPWKCSYCVRTDSSHSAPWFPPAPPIRESNTISVWNNGKGIPVVEHKDEKMYVPALIFGQLLTSSNYDDDEKKVTGERSAVEEARRQQPSATAWRLGLALPLDFSLSVWPQAEGMDTAPNSATSSAPSSPWRRPAKSTDTALSRWGERPSEHCLHVALRNLEDEE